MYTYKCQFFASFIQYTYLPLTLWSKFCFPHATNAPHYISDTLSFPTIRFVTQKTYSRTRAFVPYNSEIPPFCSKLGHEWEVDLGSLKDTVNDLKQWKLDSNPWTVITTWTRASVCLSVCVPGLRVCPLSSIYWLVN